MQYLYIGFAIPAIVSNSLILFILLRNVAYLKKSAFMTGLAVADTTLGIAVIVAGTLRVSFLEEHVYDLLIEPSYCLKHITTMLLIGVQLPAFMMFLIGSERIAAVVWFDWYYHFWSNKKSWMLTSVAYLFCTMSIAVAWMIVYSYPDSVRSPHHCTTPTVVGSLYASYNFGLACTCGVWAFVVTLLSLLRFIKTKANLLKKSGANFDLNKFIKKEYQIAWSMACLASVDFLLVVVPNILTSIGAYFPSLLVIGNYGTCMLCVKSAITVIIYPIFYPEFRLLLRKSFRLNKTTVGPSNAWVR